MILGIEIFLTAAAWKKGWKWWALLPYAISIILLLSVSAVMGLKQDEIYLVGMVGDAVVILSLIIMGAKTTKKEDNKNAVVRELTA